MKKNFTLLTMLLAAIMMSCTRSELLEVNEQPTMSESIPLQVSFVLSEPLTRSMHLPSDDDKNRSDIEDYQSISMVAVIGSADDSHLYQYDLTYVAESNTYTVMLPSNIASNSNCMLYFIANADLINGFKDLKTLGALRSAALPQAGETGIDKYVMITNGVKCIVDNGKINVSQAKLNPTVARLKFQYQNRSTKIAEVTISGTLKGGNLSEFFGSLSSSGSDSDEILIKDKNLNFDHTNNSYGWGYYYVYPAQNKPVTVTISIEGVTPPRPITIGKIKRGSSYTIKVSYEKIVLIYDTAVFEYDPATNEIRLPDDGVNNEITFEQGVTFNYASADWLTITPTQKDGNTTLRIEAGPNNSASDREAVITVTNSGGTKEQFTITQRKSSPVDIKLVNIPAGAFYMGSPETEPNRDADEVQHQVTLSKSYQISQYEITNSQYCQFLNAKGVAVDGKLDGVVLISVINNKELLFNSGNWKVVTGKENHPVVYVSWAGASKFASWAGGNLPTEAQWEYACRGEYDNKASKKNTLPFNFGNGYTLSSTTCNFAWMYNYSDSGESVISTNANSTTTMEVGKYTNAANNYGLYDMHGNVWEWCSDFYDAKYGSSDAANSVTDPTGATTGTERVLKGGSWYFFARTCRSAYRMNIAPETMSSNIGFRIVR